MIPGVWGFKQGDAAPPTPTDAGEKDVYYRSDLGGWYYIGSDGVEHPFTSVAATFAAAGLETAAEHVQLNSLNGQTSTGTTKRVFRPGDYMVGNTYDPTGTANSTTSFAAMVAAVIALNDRCAIEIPPGVFKVDPAVFTGFGSAPITIRGAGRGVTVLVPNNGTGDFIHLNSSVDGVDIGDFAIYNTSGTPFTANDGIDTNGADDVYIHDMLFVDLFNDINVNGSSIKVSMQRTVHSQTNGNASSVGILVTNGAAGDTYIGPDVVMSNTGATRRRASVEIAESGHYEVNQANLTGSVQGLLIDPAAGKIVAFGFHNEILCDSCTVNGMTLSAATATSTIKNIHSVNSWYSGTVAGGGAGVVTSGTAGGIINGITFTNDRFLNNQTHGVQHGFGTGFRFVECQAKGNSQASANASDGINVAAAVSNWNVNGGKYGGTDSAETGGNHRWGIFVAAGASNNYSVVGADLTGNTSGPLSDGGTGTVKRFVGNIGMDPVVVLITTPSAITAEAVAHQVSIPLGSLQVGTTYRIEAWGTLSATAAGTILARLRLGTAGTTGDAAVAATAAAGAATTAVGWQVTGLLTVRSTGSGGTVVGNLAVTVNATSIQSSAQTATVAVNTTVANFLSLTLTGGGTGVAVTIVNSIIEPVNR